MNNIAAQAVTPIADLNAGHNKNNNGYIPTKHLTGRISDALLNVSLLVFPMLLLSAILLGLVFRYRVRHNEPLSSYLRLSGESDESAVYYVNLNVTYLVTIASWSSSLAPMLASAIVALTSFPVAYHMLKSTRAGERNRLPTPYQLALAIGMMAGGSYGSLWQWLRYLAGWKKQRQPQTETLRRLAAALVSAVFLGFLVFLADTWLHFTTRAIAFTQIQPSDVLPDYSLGLHAQCEVNNTFDFQLTLPNGSANTHPCSVNIAATQTFLVNGSAAISALNNVSDSVIVNTYNSKVPYTYLAVPTSPDVAATDYSAITYGLQTRCRAVSADCNLNALIGASTPYFCNTNFAGDVTQDNFQFTYFTDATMTNNRTINGATNPWYFGFAALVNPQGGGLLVGANGPTDSEIVEPVHGGTAFVLACNTTVSDITYDTVNGSVSRFVARLSNDSVANAILTAVAHTSVGTPYLQQAASLATFSTTAQQLADKIALSYSRVALGIFAQAVERRPALQAQTRTASIVARVPAAPLFALVIANLLFVVAGIILFVLVLSVPGKEVKEIQARLSIVGLVADRFEHHHALQPVEKMEEMFEEKGGENSARVAIDRTDEGGYAWKVWPSTSYVLH